MKQERGASMIEIIGVLAIAGVMTAAAVAMYNVIHTNQTRKIASTEIQNIARDTKLLMELRGDYTGVSVDYLVSAGALKNVYPPIGGDEWSVTAIDSGAGFSINLVQLEHGDCQYFATTVPEWTTDVQINGVSVSGTDTNCFSTNTNQVSFIVK